MTATTGENFENVDWPVGSECDHFQQCSHVLLFAKTKKLSVIDESRKAIILMQMRFDGHLGFPGGLVDEGETPAQAVNRECSEEIGWTGNVTQEDFLFAHKNSDSIFFFYGKELSEETLENIIKKSLEKGDFGYETLGVVIVPLYTMPDSFRGLPAFLSNLFIGNAKLQLTKALVALKILSEDEVNTALQARNPKLT